MPEGCCCFALHSDCILSISIDGKTSVEAAGAIAMYELLEACPVGARVELLVERKPSLISDSVQERSSDQSASQLAAAQSPLETSAQGAGTGRVATTSPTRCNIRRTFRLAGRGKTRTPSAISPKKRSGAADTRRFDFLTQATSWMEAKEESSFTLETARDMPQSASAYLEGSSSARAARTYGRSFTVDGRHPSGVWH